MFPIPWNFPFRKKNGNLVNIGDAIDDGTELPEHGTSEAGKVLSVDASGDLEWSDAPTEIPDFDSSDAGKILSVDTNGDLEWSDDINAEIQTLAKYQDVYGSKNIWNFNPNSDIRESSVCSIAIDGNVYSFTSTGNYGGISYVYPKLLTVGRKYHMQFKSKFTKADSINGRIIVTPLESWESSGSYFNYVCESSDADFVTKDYEFIATAEKLVFDIYVQYGTESGNKFELKDLMIYDVEAILDNSYTPYAKTNKELTEDTNAIEPMLNVLGAKNLLKNTASSATVNGVTFTVNSDGSVTANGTATAKAILHLRHQLSQGKYIITGLQSDGSNQTFRIWIGIRNSTDTAWVTSYFISKESGLEFEVPSGSPYVQVDLEIYNGYTANNLVFKPMIRPASIKDDTYVPYAMTNRELTEEVDAISTLASANLTKVESNLAWFAGYDAKVYKQGRIAEISIRAAASGQIMPDTTLFTIPSGYLPNRAGMQLSGYVDMMTAGMSVPCRVYVDNGNIKLNVGMESGDNLYISGMYFIAD